MEKELNKDKNKKLTIKEKNKIILDLLEENNKLKGRIKKLNRELERIKGIIWK